LERKEWKLEWADIIRDLDNLMEMEVSIGGKGYVFRGQTPGVAGKVLQPAALPCHRPYDHAEPVSNSAKRERKRVTRPFSKLQPIGNGQLPTSWCRRLAKLTGSTVEYFGD
jgi:hypothetical protein